MHRFQLVEIAASSSHILGLYNVCMLGMKCMYGMYMYWIYVCMKCIFEMNMYCIYMHDVWIYCFYYTYAWMYVCMGVRQVCIHVWMYVCKTLLGLTNREFLAGLGHVGQVGLGARSAVSGGRPDLLGRASFLSVCRWNRFTHHHLSRELLHQGLVLCVCMYVYIYVCIPKWMKVK